MEIAQPSPTGERVNNLASKTDDCPVAEELRDMVTDSELALILAEIDPPQDVLRRIHEKQEELDGITELDSPSFEEMATSVKIWGELYDGQLSRAQELAAEIEAAEDTLSRPELMQTSRELAKILNSLISNQLRIQQETKALDRLRKDRAVIIPYRSFYEAERCLEILNKVVTKEIIKDIGDRFTSRDKITEISSVYTAPEAERMQIVEFLYGRSIRLAERKTREAQEKIQACEASGEYVSDSLKQEANGPTEEGRVLLRSYIESQFFPSEDYKAREDWNNFDWVEKQIYQEVSEIDHLDPAEALLLRGEIQGEGFLLEKLRVLKEKEEALGLVPGNDYKVQSALSEVRAQMELIADNLLGIHSRIFNAFLGDSSLEGEATERRRVFAEHVGELFLEKLLLSSERSDEAYHLASKLQAMGPKSSQPWLILNAFRDIGYSGERPMIEEMPVFVKELTDDELKAITELGGTSMKDLVQILMSGNLGEMKGNKATKLAFEAADEIFGKTEGPKKVFCLRTMTRCYQELSYSGDDTDIYDTLHAAVREMTQGKQISPEIQNSLIDLAIMSLGSTKRGVSPFLLEVVRNKEKFSVGFDGHFQNRAIEEFIMYGEGLSADDISIMAEFCEIALDDFRDLMKLEKRLVSLSDSGDWRTSSLHVNQNNFRDFLAVMRLSGNENFLMDLIEHELEAGRYPIETISLIASISMMDTTEEGYRGFMETLVKEKNIEHIINFSAAVKTCYAQALNSGIGVEELYELYLKLEESEKIGESKDLWFYFGRALSDIRDADDMKYILKMLKTEPVQIMEFFGDLGTGDYRDLQERAIGLDDYYAMYRVFVGHRSNITPERAERFIGVKTGEIRERLYELVEDGDVLDAIFLDISAYRAFNDPKKETLLLRLLEDQNGASLPEILKWIRWLPEEKIKPDFTSEQLQAAYLSSVAQMKRTLVSNGLDLELIAARPQYYGKIMQLYEDMISEMGLKSENFKLPIDFLRSYVKARKEGKPEPIIGELAAYLIEKISSEGTAYTIGDFLYSQLGDLTLRQGAGKRRDFYTPEQLINAMDANIEASQEIWETAIDYQGERPTSPLFLIANERTAPADVGAEFLPDEFEDRLGINKQINTEELKMWFRANRERVDTAYQAYLESGETDAELVSELMKLLEVTHEKIIPIYGLKVPSSLDASTQEPENIEEVVSFLKLVSLCGGRSLFIDESVRSAPRSIECLYNVLIRRKGALGGLRAAFKGKIGDERQGGSGTKLIPIDSGRGKIEIAFLDPWRGAEKPINDDSEEFVPRLSDGSAGFITVTRESMPAFAHSEGIGTMQSLWKALVAGEIAQRISQKYGI